jgi:glycosyltransferase involved in cell wall biosynthesis
MEVAFSSELVAVFWKICLLTGAFGQLGYILFFYGRVAFYKSKRVSENRPPVSVVIAARNEARNLRNHLPRILEQDYPKFEVVVVNDCSSDDSIDLLYAFQEKYKNLHVVNIIENDRHDGGKKLAITLGIKGAKYDRLLFTDADCYPVSRKWIQKMTEAAPDENAIVIGYSPYIPGSGFLNRLIRFDAFLTGINYFGFALAGIPYMGVGRNLSYAKSSFLSAGGFRTHYKLRSGDDDLFINQVAKKDNTFICLKEEACVVSIAERKWKDYWRQKRRHLTTGFRYKLPHRILLSVYPISLFIFYVASIVLLVSHNWVEITLSLVLMRILLQILIFRRSSRWLGQKDLIVFAPVFEILILIITTFAHAANAASKRVKWKT